MITKKNYYILAAIVAVCVLAYVGILSLCGFTDGWKWVKLTVFALLTYVLLLGPLLLLLKVWSGVKAAEDQAYQKMKESHDKPKA